MAEYFMFGKYSSDAIKGINASRTEEAQKIVKDLGGSIKDMYALLGQHDLVLIVDLPSLEVAMKASLAITKMSGIAFSTSPAINVKDFDKIVS